MRKIIVSNMVSLDGYFAGLNGEIDWHVVNDEFLRDAVTLLNAMDTILFGRITYEGMAEYWTTPEAINDAPIIAEKMNTLAKVVVSNTLDNVEWQNSTLIKAHLADEITKLKQQPGKDIVILGSGTLVATLTQLGLIDDYIIYVCPIILGNGKMMFSDMDSHLNLKLVEAKPYTSGTVVLRYQLHT
jgi:dihydrofolate reductase